MPYHQGLVYHVFNQGNNKEPIFFERENYFFFLRKMSKHLLPYTDLLAYCLMPNHFHWLLVPKEAGISLGNAVKPKSKFAAKQVGGTSEVPPTYDLQQNLSQQIGILLSGYTKAINKRYHRSGSLFRKNTKCKTDFIDDFITINSPHQDKFFQIGNHYAIRCFDYIHQNPVEAKLVLRPEDWEFSSARDYAGLRKGTLCNYSLAETILGVKR